MMTEWATVVTWQQGIATLRCERKLSCNHCQSHSVCGVKIVNKWGSNMENDINLWTEQPLVVGQQIELGFPAASFLRLASLLYFFPLLTMSSSALLANEVFESDLSLIIGGFIGGYLGFLVAHFYAKKLERKKSYQPIILQIISPCSLDSESL